MTGAAEPMVGGQSSGWFKSTLSNGACACVEVMFVGGQASIRDSKFRRDVLNDLLDEPTITVSSEAFTAWLAELEGSASAGANDSLVARPNADGTTSIVSLVDGTDLRFTPEEWTAFLGGVRLGEFAPQPTPV